MAVADDGKLQLFLSTNHITIRTADDRKVNVSYLPPTLVAVRPQGRVNYFQPGYFNVSASRGWWLDRMYLQSGARKFLFAHPSPPMTPSHPNTPDLTASSTTVLTTNEPVNFLCEPFQPWRDVQISREISSRNLQEIFEAAFVGSSDIKFPIRLEGLA
jgi:hypothetical protein